MQALKALVIFMGILIVGLSTAIGYGLYKRIDNPDFKFFASDDPQPAQTQAQPPVSGDATPASPSAPAQGAAFGTVDLNLPEGAKVISSQMNGTTLMLNVATQGGDQADTLIMIDTATGQVKGRVNLGQGAQ